MKPGRLFAVAMVAWVAALAGAGRWRHRPAPRLRVRKTWLAVF
jgi:hypothetical protein